MEATIPFTNYYVQEAEEYFLLIMVEAFLYSELVVVKEYFSFIIAFQEVVEFPC